VQIHSLENISDSELRCLFRYFLPILTSPQHHAGDFGCFD
jgi:hypothetical protein